MSSSSESQKNTISQDQEDQQQKLSEDYDEKFTFEKKEKRFQQMTFLLGCLRNHFIFYNLSNAQLQNVAKQMSYCYVPLDSFIFKQGNKSLWFFIIEKGSMNIIVQGKIKKQLRVGEGFGQIALLYKASRLFSVQACQGCCLWGIDRNTFRSAVEEIILKEYQDNKIFMENVKFFRLLRNDHKQAIAASLVAQFYTKGQTIVHQGEPGSCFYIIKEGEASVWKGNQLFTKITKPDTFGEQSLFYNTVRHMSIKAQSDVTCLVLSREILSQVLGDQIFLVTFKNFIKVALQKSPHISKLRKEEHEKIIDLMKINVYKAGNIIIKKGNDGNLPTNQKIIVVIEGSIKKAKNINLAAIRSQVYGQQFLLENKSKHRYDDDIVMHSNGVLAEIKADLVKDIIGGSIDVVIEKRSKIAAFQFNQAMERRKKQMIIDLRDLLIVKQLNEGEYGPIFLVSCNKQRDKKLYVLKCFEKVKIEKQKLYKYLQQEINLMKKLQHPFIIQGYKTFQDNMFLYSLTEFIRGEELYDVIRQMGLLGTQDAQFYIGCMILIIQYLSEHGIFLRDIKPQGFTVQMQGYLVLTDLVSAKVYKSSNIFNKTYTMIGTPHYMAPQIITSKGYSFYASLYSLGIILFQFMCGFVPFGQKNQDPLQIYQEILNSELNIPKFIKDNDAKKLIQQLLNKFQPQNRLGGPTLDSLKNNAWFQKLQWNLLKNKKLQSPIFNRNPNVQESQIEILRLLTHAKNCSELLDARFSERNTKIQSQNFVDNIYSEW